MRNINNIREELKVANDAYREGTPIMSDVEYKKSAINYPIKQAKGIHPSAKRLWKSTPVAKLISNK